MPKSIRKFLIIEIFSNFSGGVKRLVAQTNTEKVGCAAHGRIALQFLEKLEKAK